MFTPPGGAGGLGLDLDKENLDEVGVIIGSGIGGLATTTEQYNILLQRGPSRVSPFTIPMLIGNMASGLVSMYFKLRGPNFATCSACATANPCALARPGRTIKMRRRRPSCLLKQFRKPAIVPHGHQRFAAMKAMSTRNDDPQHASRPFDKDRDGFVMGEGSGVLVLEELEHAKSVARKSIAK